MSTAALASSAPGTLADLHERLGSIPLHRIRCQPAPGTATEADVLIHFNGEKRLCELVDGVLVEKPMGYYESRLAACLIGFLEHFLDVHDLGIVLGADATLRLAPGLVRLPDVSFISWEHFPNRELPAEPIPDSGTRSCSRSIERREHGGRDGAQAAGIFRCWCASGLVRLPRAAHSACVHQPPACPYPRRRSEP